MAAKPLVIALEEHYLDDEVKARSSPADAQEAGSPPETAKRLADLGARCASGRWTRPASISRYCRHKARPRCRRWMRKAPSPSPARPMTGCSRRVAPTRTSALCFRRLPDSRSESRGRRARAHGDQVRRQGRDDPRPTPAASSTTTSASWRDLRARRGARRPALHPSRLSASGGWSGKAYYKGYIETRLSQPSPPPPGASGVETATQGIRFVLSGVFDKYPKLQIVLGHMGEGLLLLRLAHQSEPGAARQCRRGEIVPRRVQLAFLRHDQRLLLRSGAAMLHHRSSASTG